MLLQVEVGCLEEVLGFMEKDTKGDWLNILIVAPGSLSGGTGSTPASPDHKK